MLIGKTVGLHRESLLQGGIQVAQIFYRSEMSHIVKNFYRFIIHYAPDRRQ